MLLFLRDKANLFFTFFFNAFLMVMLGWMVQSRNDSIIKVGIYDELKSEFSEGFIASLSSAKMEAKVYPKFEDLEKNIKKGEITVGIDIKKSFGQLKNTDVSKIKNPETHLVMYGNSSKEMWMKMMKLAIKMGILSMNEKTNSTLNKINIESKLVQVRELSFFAFIFPGVLLFTIMGLAFTGSITLLHYREKDTLKRLKITPLKKSEFLLGYALSYFIFLIAQVFLYLLVGTIFFKYTFTENLLQVAILIISTGVLFMSLGLCIVNLSKSIDIGNNIIRFLNFPASFLCGVFIPLETMPKIMQGLAYCHPLTYLVRAIQGAANLSASFHDNLTDYITIPQSPKNRVCFFLIAKIQLCCLLFPFE